MMLTSCTSTIFRHSSRHTGLSLYTCTTGICDFGRFLGIDRKGQHVVDRDYFPPINPCVDLFDPPSSC